MRSFRLFGFLLRNARSVVLTMVGAGVLSGLFSAGVLAVVSRAVTRGSQIPSLLLWGFIGLAAGKIISNAAAQLLLVRFSQGTILDLSLTLCAKILSAPLRLIERRGGAHILTTLTDDVSSVTWAVQSLPQLAMNGAVVLGCSVYLAWLSPLMFLGVIAVTLLGAGVYKLLHTRAFSRIYASRDARARLFGHFRALIGGIKELMMHRGRREAFVQQEVRAAAAAYREHNLAATTHYAVAEAWVQTLYHGLIALVLFAFPLVARPTPEALTGYVFAMLYMMAPLWSIISAFPAVARGQVALAKIEELGVSIDAAAAAGPADRARHTETADDALTVRMTDVVFSYADDAAVAQLAPSATPEEPAFVLGPLDFHLAPGELVFVVGGNGSGKSTFVKVLTGLYAPHGGTLAIGGAQVSDADREWYREHFSVVFADCFLFDKLLGLGGPGLDEAARRYLQLLQIDHKVTLRTDDGVRAFSTIDLSTGQRKRLALITAYLEDRPFYVFDEWAADQDPEYKRIFYAKLLPELRARGKAVVVITHDDRYFHMGDRVVKLEDGRVVPWDGATDAHAARVPAGSASL